MRRLLIIWLCGLLIICSAPVSAQPEITTWPQDSVLTNLQRQCRLAHQDTAQIVLISKIADRCKQLGKLQASLPYLKNGLHIARQSKNSLNLGRSIISLEITISRYITTRKRLVLSSLPSLIYNEVARLRRHPKPCTI